MTVRPGHVALRELILALQEGDKTRGELAEASGLALSTVGEYVASWRGKLLRRTGWVRRPGRPEELLSWGGGRDVPRMSMSKKAIACKRRRIEMGQLRAARSVGADLQAALGPPA